MGAVNVRRTAPYTVREMILTPPGVDPRLVGHLHATNHICVGRFDSQRFSTYRCSEPTKNVFAPQITTDDQAEITQARDIAVIFICVEVIAAVAFCSSEACGTVPLVAVLSSSPVACFSRHRVTYLLWSCTGAVLCVVHVAIAAKITSIEQSHSWFPIVFSVHIFLCCVSLVVVYRGCRAASATRRSVYPIENQLFQTPGQAPMHPVAETHQHSQVSNMLP